MIETISEKTFSFAEFELDTVKRLLLKAGKSCALNPKAFDLLTVLVNKHGQILSKDELLETVWEGSFVEENNLTVHISALRKIFGERKGEHQFIVTIPGKGYKFIAELRQKVNDSLVKSNGLADKKRSSNAFDESEKIIGRETEITEIKDLLRRQNKCLITLTGAGGSGKTKLARTIADECRTEFADGVFFIELAAINQIELVVGAIAQILDVKESSAKTLLDALKDFLRERSVLLVLDNFEQILSAAPVLKELSDSALNLKILITSRTSLPLKFGQEKLIAPLAVPPPNLNLSAVELTAFPAVELFALRAQSARTNFVLSQENAAVVAEICQKLDGLPLAIELAAVRVKLLSPNAILARLENSLNLLTGGAKDLPSRQRTMRGAVEWSYELLEPAEQKLFRRLAVFADGFAVEAAEAIGEEENIHSSQNTVLDLLDSLVENNLLVVKEQADGNVRLRMLEVVREFAFECLESKGEYELLRKCHAEYFLNFAEEMNPYLNLTESAVRCNRLEDDHGNLRIALDFLTETAVGKAARMAAAMWLFWYYHNHFTEGRRLITFILKQIDTDMDISAVVRFRLFRAVAGFAQIQGDYEASQTMYEECIAIARADHHLPHLALALGGLGMTLYSKGDFNAAQSLIEEGLTIHRELENKDGIAAGLNFLGNLFLAKDETTAARPFFEEALQLSRENGNKDAISSDLSCLGVIAVENEDFEAAREYLAESLLMAEELGNKIMTAHCLDGFAALASVTGKYEQSAKIAGAVDSLREKLGYANEPAEEVFREKHLKTTRAALNPQDFTNAYNQGRGLNFNESIALTKIAAFDFSDVSDEIISEIIVETHQTSRIIIEEEIPNQT